MVFLFWGKSLSKKKKTPAYRDLHITDTAVFAVCDRNVERVESLLDATSSPDRARLGVDAELVRGTSRAEWGRHLEKIVVKTLFSCFMEIWRK